MRAEEAMPLFFVSTSYGKAFLLISWQSGLLDFTRTISQSSFPPEWFVSHSTKWVGHFTFFPLSAFQPYLCICNNIIISLNHIALIKIVVTYVTQVKYLTWGHLADMSQELGTTGVAVNCAHHFELRLAMGYSQGKIRGNKQGPRWCESWET